MMKHCATAFSTTFNSRYVFLSKIVLIKSCLFIVTTDAIQLEKNYCNYFDHFLAIQLVLALTKF